jgi:hypothetical protein
LVTADKLEVEVDLMQKSNAKRTNTGIYRQIKNISPLHIFNKLERASKCK